MSLVTGLLTHQCTIKRPQFDVNENITGYTTVGTNVLVLISQKTSAISTGDGGREVVTFLVAIFEFMDQTQVNVNDVLTNVTNVSSGRVIQESVNGGPLTATSFKITGDNNPNQLDDHLELPVESFHGRVEGQP